MPSVIIIRDHGGRLEVLLQRRNMGLNEGLHWCCPGGSLDPAERATRDDWNLSDQVRQAAVRRGALREIIEECGGGECRGAPVITFNLAELIHAPLGLVDLASVYSNALVPPGLLGMVEDEGCVRPLSGGRRPEKVNHFAYVVSDVNALDVGWAAGWRPRARRPWRYEMDEAYVAKPGAKGEAAAVVAHAYTWVDLEHLATTRGLGPGVVGGSSMPLVSWDRPWFDPTQGLAELRAAIKSLQQAHARPPLPGAAAVQQAAQHQTPAKGVGAPCKFYASVFGCRFGERCRYSHAAEALAPASGIGGGGWGGGGCNGGGGVIAARGGGGDEANWGYEESMLAGGAAAAAAAGGAAEAAAVASAVRPAAAAARSDTALVAAPQRAAPGSCVARFADAVEARGIKVVAFAFDGAVVPPSQPGWLAAASDGGPGAGPGGDERSVVAGYEGPGLHPLSHGFMALAAELSARGLHLAIVHADDGSRCADGEAHGSPAGSGGGVATVRRVLGPGQPLHLRPVVAALGRASGVFERVLASDTLGCGGGGGGSFVMGGEVAVFPHAGVNRFGSPVANLAPCEQTSWSGGPGFRGVEKNAMLRLVCHRAAAAFAAAGREEAAPRSAHPPGPPDRGDGFSGGSDSERLADELARATLLVDGHGPSCAAWVALGGHAYAPADEGKGVGLEVRLDPRRIVSAQAAVLGLGAMGAREAAWAASDAGHWAEWLALWEADGREAGRFWE